MRLRRQRLSLKKSGRQSYDLFCFRYLQEIMQVSFLKVDMEQE